MKIVKKEILGKENVYDIGVYSENSMNNFILENKIIASNCFNKAHSVSYSLLTYISAYLKTHYPIEFFTALMSTRSKTLQPKSWAVKAPEYIQEAKKFNVFVYPPSVNKSGYEFTIANNEIYFGLNAIRDVGKTAAKSIIKARGNIQFKSILDFVERVNLQKVNTKTFEALVYAGAFDKMGYIRKELLEKTSEIYFYIRSIEEYRQRKIDVKLREQVNSKNLPLIERRNFLRKETKKINNKIDKDKAKEEDYQNLNIYTPELEELEDLKLKKLVTLKLKERPTFPELSRVKENELDLKDITNQAHYIGCYLGGHPLQFVTVVAKKITTLDIADVETVAGVILSIKEIKTKKGKLMAFIDINDISTSAELICFPGVWSKLKKLEIKEGQVIKAKVKTEQIDPDYKLILYSLEIIETSF